MLAQALRKHKIPFVWWVKILSTGGAIRAIENKALDTVIVVRYILRARKIWAQLGLECVAPALLCCPLSMASTRGPFSTVAKVCILCC